MLFKTGNLAPDTFMQVVHDNLDKYFHTNNLSCCFKLVCKKECNKKSI